VSITDSLQFDSERYISHTEVRWHHLFSVCKPKKKKWWAL